MVSDSTVIRTVCIMAQLKKFCKEKFVPKIKFKNSLRKDETFFLDYLDLSPGNSSIHVMLRRGFFSPKQRVPLTFWLRSSCLFWKSWSQSPQGKAFSHSKLEFKIRTRKSTLMTFHSCKFVRICVSQIRVRNSLFIGYYLPRTKNSLRT